MHHSLRLMSVLIAWLMALVPVALASVQAASSPEKLVEGYVDAFNSQDIGKLKSVLHPNVEWIDISGSSQTIVSSGMAQLTREMEGYFNSGFAGKSVIENISINGNFISGKETVRWTDSYGIQRQQASVVVFELSTGMIRRVWYFPAQE